MDSSESGSSGACFESMQISWKCKPIIKLGVTCLLTDLLIKSIFNVIFKIKVIWSPNFKTLFSEKSGFEWNNWFWNSWFVVLSSKT